MDIITVFLIGISLSMDAFSLSLCYGTLNFKNNKIFLLSLIVGIYHFIMPQLGMSLGHFIEQYILIDVKYIVFIIFIVLGIEMINTVIKNKRNVILLNNFGLLLFGFSVSIDSFSAGIGVEFINDNHLLCSIVFSITSFIFTYLGLKIGSRIERYFKDLAPLIGGLILIILALFYVFK